MKKISFRFIPLVAIATLFTLLSSFNPSPQFITNAASENIDSTDTSADEIQDYYSSIVNLSGVQLLTSLSDIIDNHTTVSYAKAFEWMIISDRDYLQSPLTDEELLNYDFNAIKNDDPYMRIMYRNDNFLPTAQKYWLNSNDRTFDREHTWAQSLGSFDTSAGKGTDLHHLFASDEKNNQNGHGNLMYGNADNNAQLIGDTPYNQTGYTGYQNGNSTVKIYEPLDEVKGDIARALFYMATRYDEDLHLAFGLDNLGKNTIGNLEVLLEWNELDPVDQFEIHRNNLIFNNIQYNRNPFIDYPEWANAIWGDGVANVGVDEPCLIENTIDIRPSANGRLEVASLPNKTTYTRGEPFSSEGLVINKVNGTNVRPIETYELSIVDGTILNEPGTIEVHVIAKEEKVTYTSFTIEVNNTTEETPISTTIYSTGFDYEKGTNYEGTVTVGPEGQQWIIDGNISETKAGSMDGLTARMRLYNNGIANKEIKMDFDVNNASKLEFDTMMNANLTLDVYYSVDHGLSYEPMLNEDGTLFINKKYTSRTHISLDVPEEAKNGPIRFKWALGDESIRPGSKNYELSLDNVRISGENYNTPYDDYLLINDMPRTTYYHVGDKFDASNLLISQASYTNPTAIVSNYTLSIQNGTILNEIGRIDVIVTSNSVNVTPVSFPIYVYGEELSPAQIFANKLATYRTCDQYIDAYNDLIDDYNALSEGDKAALTDIFINDYSYEEYIQNGSSYDGLNPSVRINAHEKWMQIVAYYETNQNANWLEVMLRSPETYIAVVVISISIVTISLTAYFINKKIKAKNIR